MYKGHMDECSGKRGLGGISVPRKGSGLVLRDASDCRDRNAQFCNRLGCNGRLNHTKVAQIVSSEGPKLLRPSFRSSTGKEVIGNSSKTTNTINSVRKSFHGSQKKLSSKMDTNSSESSSVRDEGDVQELVFSSRKIRSEFMSSRDAKSGKVTLTDVGRSGISSRKIRSEFMPESRDAKSSKVTLTEVGRSGISSNTSTRKVYSQKSTVANQDNKFGSTSSSASESIGREPRENYITNRYGLGKLGSNSTPATVPQGGSNSESNSGRRGDVIKKRNTEGESSSSIRRKKVGQPSSFERRVPLSTGVLSISDRRQVKSSPGPREVGISSVRTRRTVGGNIRVGRINQLQGNNSSSTESPMLTSHLPKPEMYRFSADTSSSGSNTNSRPTSSDGLSDSIIRVTSADRGVSRLINRDGPRRYTADGIAEVLLALERIEQDEELTYEQLLSLETNLFLGGLSFYDQHRDMRLDIDNMSYEELLALEEEMGTVSTALSEEALSKCLKVDIYQPSFSKDSRVVDSGDGDDIKCSICQEEYCIGEEIGRMGCEHGFHASCINHWLRLKKWCPICKTEVKEDDNLSS